jgi:uncharacterized protein (DUF1800 family)
MKGRKSQLLFLAAAVFVLIVAGAVPVAALDDSDPNSPVPILLSQPGSTRALAVPQGDAASVILSRVVSRPFPPDARMVLFVTNVDLMPTEGANAFRVYGQDRRGHVYRFPVLSLERLRRGGPVYAVTIQLTDEIGYWSPPPADGDLLVQITWRGQGSNRVRVGLGQTEGGIVDDPGARPTPFGEKIAKRTSPTGAPDYVGYRWSGDRMRLLEQATFGPTAALDERVRRIGPRAWLNEQFNADYPSLNNSYPNQPLRASSGSDPFCDNDNSGLNGNPIDEPVTCYRDTYSMYQPQTWFFREAFYGEPQLRHRVSWALQQIWVTSGLDIQQGRHMVEYHKVISNNAFGNYRNLMKQMTLHPTMGTYLSMALSTKNNPNENYAREVMQLFTIGLFMLNQDGTLQLDTLGNPIPTYDQNGVNNLTKVFTGWRLCNLEASCPNIVLGAENYIDPMRLSNNSHDLTAKTLLSYPGVNNQNIPACTGCTGAAIATYANASMDQALDNIFYHPNVAPFVSKILIQQMVTSDPSPAYVGRVAAVFNNNGLGVRGDLKSVVRAILLDPEARGDVKTDPMFGKLREPVLYMTNVLRALKVRSANGQALSDGYMTGRSEINGMAQVPFVPPTVFNYYPPGYVVPGTAMLGPEFAILTTGTSIVRANFGNRFVFNNTPIAGGTVNAPNGTSVDMSDLQALATADTTGNQLLDELNARMLHGTMSDAMRSTILTAVTAVPATTSENFLLRARQAVYLVATSSQFQVQR